MWATGVAYKVDNVVTYQSKTYKCEQAHTSQNGWGPVDTPTLNAKISKEFFE